MFKKMAFAAGLLLAITSQAGMRITAHIDINHWDINRNEYIKHIDFKGSIGENHYTGITTFCNETGYKLNIEPISVSDTIVAVEFSVQDVSDNIIFNRILVCTWNTSTFAKMGGYNADNTATLVAFTVTVSHD